MYWWARRLRDTVSPSPSQPRLTAAAEESGWAEEAPCWPGMPGFQMDPTLLARMSTMAFVASAQHKAASSPRLGSPRRPFHASGVVRPSIMGVWKGCLSGHRSASTIFPKVSLPDWPAGVQRGFLPEATLQTGLNHRALESNERAAPRWPSGAIRLSSRIRGPPGTGRSVVPGSG